ncbi:MAG: hypothetical protein ACTSYE_07585, partial [Alphaproteobacteria bacterium]
QAFATMRAAWEEQFSCGPGYVLGDQASAHGLAIAGDRQLIGVPINDIARTSWYEPARLHAEGAIVAFRKPVPEDEMARYLPDVAIMDVRTLTLPLLRTASGATITYHYFFIPPQSC